MNSSSAVFIYSLTFIAIAECNRMWPQGTACPRTSLLWIRLTQTPTLELQHCSKKHIRFLYAYVIANDHFDGWKERRKRRIRRYLMMGRRHIDLSISMVILSAEERVHHQSFSTCHFDIISIKQQMINLIIN